MRALKAIMLNLGFLALLFGVMLPAANAEGQLGQCSVEAVVFYVSFAMTVLSALSYVAVGRRSLLVLRCTAVVVVLLLLLMFTLYIVFEKPAFTKDIAQYWVGAAISVFLIVLQGFWNRHRFALLLYGHYPEIAGSTNREKDELS